MDNNPVNQNAVLSSESLKENAQNEVGSIREYFYLLVRHYKNISLDTVLFLEPSEDEMTLFWTGNPALAETCAGPLGVGALFEKGILPQTPGFYMGMKQQMPQLLYLSKDGPIVIVQVVSSNLPQDLLSLPAMQNALFQMDAELRQSTSSIIHSLQNIYSVLAEEDAAREIDLINISMIDCYRIMRTSMVPKEIMRYAVGDEGEIAPALIDLRDFFHSQKSILARIFIKEKVELLVSVERGTRLLAHPDRLIYALIFCIRRLCEAVPNVRKIYLKAARRDNDLIFTVMAKEGKKGVERLCSPIYWPQKDEEVSLTDTLYLPHLFCMQYGGQLFFTSGETPAVGMRFPPEAQKIPSDSVRGHISFSSPSPKKSEMGRFSPWHLAFSDLGDFRFYPSGSDSSEK